MMNDKTSSLYLTTLIRSNLRIDWGLSMVKKKKKIAAILMTHSWTLLLEVLPHATAVLRKQSPLVDGCSCGNQLSQHNSCWSCSTWLLSPLISTRTLSLFQLSRYEMITKKKNPYTIHQIPPGHDRIGNQISYFKNIDKKDIFIHPLNYTTIHFKCKCLNILHVRWKKNQLFKKGCLF